eukprot:TRINITY_DN3287_c0_g1_i4.p1 TRINITY_DN3287_c0_g1~~TRINITY_DN3287_c0_g1_i4.p1  ORF type:complete len:341 (-),score=41.42 TRINITY_DN3287_c0_g1_i4:386-1336(-)
MSRAVILCFLIFQAIGVLASDYSTLVSLLKSSATTPAIPAEIVITSDILVTADLPPVGMGVQLTVKGACSGGPCKIDGQGKYRLFRSAASSSSLPDCSITLSNLYLTGAVYAAVSSECSVNATDVVFKNNVNTMSGGAVYVGTLAKKAVFQKCHFTDNVAGVDGGAAAIETQGIITDCTFAGNSAKHRGGALYINALRGVPSEVNDGTFIANRAGGEGGAIHVQSSTSIVGSTFLGNSAVDAGGISIAGDFSTVGICDSNFFQNTAQTRQGSSVAVLRHLVNTFFCPAPPSDVRPYSHKKPIRTDCGSCTTRRQVA